MEEYKKVAPNLDHEGMLEAFDAVVKMSLTYMSQNLDRDTPLVKFKTPEQLRAEIDLKIGTEGVGFTAILAELQKTLDYSVRTGHVRFFNQLWAGTDKAAVIGEWLTAVMNSSMYTYEVSPVFTLMEMDILKKLRGLVGWQEGDGVFAPGGAHCNLLGMLAARNITIPTMKKSGLPPNQSVVCFTSSHSHYTVERCCSVMGFGTDSCLEIPVEMPSGKINVSELDRQMTAALAQGKIIFAVCITAGTTVLGAYDDIDAVGDVCHKHKVWLHVDACWGGHCLLSAKHRSLMKGAHKADSIAWTATKCLGLPQQCAVLLLKKPGVLYSCNAMHEDYLFHQHDEKDFDLGDRTLNCGRRVDAFKLWVSWKVYGDKGFEERVDHAFDQAQYIAQQIQKKPGVFELVMDKPESLNVCFYFVPPSARNLPKGEERSEKMSKATTIVRRKMQLEGKVLTNYSNLDGVHGHFWRHITCNPGATEADMDFVLSEIERLGADL